MQCPGQFRRRNSSRNLPNQQSRAGLLERNWKNSPGVNGDRTRASRVAEHRSNHYATPAWLRNVVLSGYVKLGQNRDIFILDIGWLEQRWHLTFLLTSWGIFFENYEYFSYPLPQCVSLTYCALIDPILKSVAVRPWAKCGFNQSPRSAFLKANEEQGHL